MFELDVISDPGASLAPDTPMWLGDLSRLVDYDITLVKPSLLFADKVTLFSFRTSMLHRAHSEAFKMTYMPVRVLPAYLRFVADPNDADLQVLEINPSQLPPKQDARAVLELFDNGKTDRFYESSMQFMDRYKAELGDFMRRMFLIWKQRWEAMNTNELESAVSSGTLEILGWSDDEGYPPHIRAFEAELEFCVRSANHMLSQLLQSGHVPLIDPGAHFVLGLEATGQTKSTKLSTDILSPSSIAASVVARLPGLDRLAVPEILDLRSDLEPYLVPFRAAMVAIADDISAESSEDTLDLRHEVDRRWHRDIAPTLAEIENSMRKATYSRKLLTAITRDKASLTGMASGITLAVGTLAAGLVMVTPAAALGLGLPFLEALRAMAEERDEIKSKQLYFLYEAKKRIVRKRK